MAGVKVNWHDQAHDDGTADDFCAQASETLYDWLVSTDAGSTNHAQLYTQLVTAGVGPAAWYRQTPWTALPEWALGKDLLPCVLIWTNHTGHEFRETDTLHPLFRTRLTIVSEHADLVTGRTRAHRIAQIIGARLAQASFSGALIQGNALWFSHYWNWQEPINYSVTEVELTGDEEAPELYALELAFDWEHTDDRS